MVPKVDARGDFQCPRMIDCHKVCQGHPYKCEGGKCIYEGASVQLLPNEKICSSSEDCFELTCSTLTRAKCVEGRYRN